MSAKVNTKKYQAIRGKLIARGTNLARWAVCNGYPKMTVYGAAKRERAGRKAKQILKELETFINA